MNLTTILAALGLGDGQGNTSSTRLILLLVTVSWLTTKTAAALKTGQPMTFDENDRWMLGIILGGGIGKTIAEGKAETSTQTKG